MMINHCLLKVAAILAAITWQNIDPIFSTSLQAQDGACEDLSPHCPVLCTPCEEASKWPVGGSHEIDDASSSGSSQPPPTEDQENTGQQEEKPETETETETETEAEVDTTTTGGGDKEDGGDDSEPKLDAETQPEAEGEGEAQPPLDAAAEPDDEPQPDVETNNPEKTMETTPEEASAEPEDGLPAPDADAEKKRKKRFAANSNNNPTAVQGQGGWMHWPWMKIPAQKPDWLPGWIPWPKNNGKGETTIATDQSNDGNQAAGPQVPPPPAGMTAIQGPPSSAPPTEGCGEGINGGRQLIESMCPKSCGVCGRRSDPQAAARAFIAAQCTMARGLGVGLALK